MALKSPWCLETSLQFQFSTITSTVSVLVFMAWVSVVPLAVRSKIGSEIAIEEGLPMACPEKIRTQCKTVMFLNDCDALSHFQVLGLTLMQRQAHFFKTDRGKFQYWALPYCWQFRLSSSQCRITNSLLKVSGPQQWPGQGLAAGLGTLTYPQIKSCRQSSLGAIASVLY